MSEILKGPKAEFAEWRAPQKPKSWGEETLPNIRKEDIATLEKATRVPPPVGEASEPAEWPEHVAAGKQDVLSAQELEELGKEMKDVLPEKTQPDFNPAMMEATLPAKSKLDQAYEAFRPEVVRQKNEKYPTDQNSQDILNLAFDEALQNEVFRQNGIPREKWGEIRNQWNARVELRADLIERHIQDGYANYASIYDKDTKRMLKEMMREAQESGAKAA